jgi:hypothetical protein
MKIRIAVAVAALAAVALAGCSSSAKSDSGAAKTTAKTTAKAAVAAKTSKAAPKTSVSHDLGSKDASADVKAGAIVMDPTLNVPSVPLTVTNNSSKRSNYLITVALESADGKTQVDTTIASVDDLDPGQTAATSAQFFKPDMPAGTIAVIKTVDRLAS